MTEYHVTVKNRHHMTEYHVTVKQRRNVHELFELNMAAFPPFLGSATACIRLLTFFIPCTTLI